jgi:hypothetical protein
MLVILSVVVRNVDIVGIALAPTETDSKLIVDSDAVLAGALSCELFQTKAREAKVCERGSRIEQSQLGARLILYAPKLPARQTLQKLLRFLAFARANHRTYSILQIA